MHKEEYMQVMFMHESLNQELKNHNTNIYELSNSDTINLLRYVSIATNKHRDHFCFYIFIDIEMRNYTNFNPCLNLYIKKKIIINVISQMIFLSCFTRITYERILTV